MYYLHHRRGLTFVEMLVVISIVAIVSGAILMIVLQSSRMFARTSAHIQPQESQMLALRKIEGEVREAMGITVGSDPMIIEILQPLKDPSPVLMNVIDGTTLQQGQRVCYFLGRKEGVSGNSWTTAVPDSVNGDTVFRIYGASPETPIIPFSTGTSFTSGQATVVIDGLLPRSKQDSTDPPLFQYVPTNAKGEAVAGTNRLRVNFIILVPEQRPGGSTEVKHILSTEFCIRNLNSSQPG
ncbi:MAG: PilW family protein [Armatimonadota bacterium]